MKTFVVTGGGGFLGTALCKELAKDGSEVRALGRKSYPHLRDFGIGTIECDITKDFSLLCRSFDGADAVFHVAAKVDMWGDYESFFHANVQGTRNVIEACRRVGVTKLIFTSSPSVIADGTDLCGIDETYPYPSRYKAYYPMTKAQAEREVLDASSSALRTIALRPHLIFGPGDTSLTEKVIERAKVGKLVQIGAGKNLVDFSFIEDCVSAHICALSALDSGHPGGKAYFISQGDPFPLWEWINEVVTRSGLSPISRKLPASIARFLAAVCEGCVNLLPSKPEPLLSRFLVSEMATHHYFSIHRAQQELGYHPRYSVKEALDITFKTQPLLRSVG